MATIITDTAPGFVRVRCALRNRAIEHFLSCGCGRLQKAWVRILFSFRFLHAPTCSSASQSGALCRIRRPLGIVWWRPRILVSFDCFQTHVYPHIRAGFEYFKNEQKDENGATEHGSLWGSIFWFFVTFKRIENTRSAGATVSLFVRGKHSGTSFIHI